MYNRGPLRKILSRSLATLLTRRRMAAYRPWNEDPVVLPGEEVSLAPKKPRPSWPKRKVALMMGYCGTGYQGMQLYTLG